MRNRRPSSIDLKIVVLGSHNVGKTSLIHRYCEGSFVKDTLPTLGAGFFTHSLVVDDIEVTAMLWDTAGDERFHSVAPSLLRGTQGLILVFDLSDPQTFLDIEIYFNMFLDTCQVDMARSLPVLLLGNKNDLEQHSVGLDVIDSWMKKNHVSHYFDVSAKTAENVNEAIETLIKDLVSPLEYQTSQNSLSLPLSESAEAQQSSCC